MTDLTQTTFTATTSDPTRVGIVVFHATWCAPSRSQLALLDRLAAGFAGKPVFIARVDVDAEPELADRYEIRTLPSTLLMAAGETVELLVGYQAEEFLKSYLEQLLEALPPAASPPPSAAPPSAS
ncbi:MAG: Thioredoxin [Candidatus Ozemobacter sibiricus]|jgi:thioredoxin 1|uniref:Thioredoxin n=1 Tax=Candidatus Ozemobacter sibiricus TaxID=2268124 RepID=A0A367ZU97_9BACT|nr:MAG: Thioredoxin [Candidatus Ozemobacter sibiricus]